MSDEKLFIGPNEVVKIDIAEQKTPAGKEIAIVHYKGENVPSEQMPLAIFNILKSSEPVDFTTLCKKRHEQLLLDMTALMLEAGVRYGEVGYVLEAMKKKLQTVFDRVVHFLTNGDDKQFAPGMDPLTDFSLLQADAVLKKIQPDGKSS